MNMSCSNNIQAKRVAQQHFEKQRAVWNGSEDLNSRNERYNKFGKAFRSKCLARKQVLDINLGYSKQSCFIESAR